LDIYWRNIHRQNESAPSKRSTPNAAIEEAAELFKANDPRKLIAVKRR
jgi:hypothetical protein